MDLIKTKSGLTEICAEGTVTEDLKETGLCYFGCGRKEVVRFKIATSPNKLTSCGHCTGQFLNLSQEFAVKLGEKLMQRMKQSSENKQEDFPW